jgi:exopolysaccharide biosynthesis predicted pyruvyltransferase EpsI
MVSYLDMRRFRGAELPGLDQIVALGGPGNTGDVSLWINRKRQRTYVMAAYPSTPTAKASVQAYLNGLSDVITRTASRPDSASCRER